MEIETVRIVAPVVQGNETGFVVINKADFDESAHELYEEGGAEGSGKMTVAQIREALAAKGVEIPAGAKKDELQALLDAQE